jgi:beta-fructofuranosidase
MEPVEAVESLRGRHVHLHNVKVTANRETVLEDIKGNSIEMQVKIRTGNAPVVELDVLRSPDRAEFTRILLFRDRGFRDRTQGAKTADSIITIDTSHSSILPDALSRPPESAPLHLEPEANLELRIFIDRSVVEVFANGIQCVAVRVYPGRGDSTGVSILSKGRDIEILRLDLWELTKIKYGLAVN